MGVTIQEYRCRIGRFLPKFSKPSSTNLFSKNKNDSTAKLSLQQIILLSLVILAPFMIALLQFPLINHSNQSYSHPTFPTFQGLYTPAKNIFLETVNSNMINLWSTPTAPPWPATFSPPWPPATWQPTSSRISLKYFCSSVSTFSERNGQDDVFLEALPDDYKSPKQVHLW